MKKSFKVGFIFAKNLIGDWLFFKIRALIVTTLPSKCNIEQIL